MVPTEAGVEFLKRAQDALKALDAMRTLGGDLAQAPSGHVVVGLPVSAGSMVSVPLVQAVRSQYPAVTLGLLESPSVYLGELLLRGKIDVAVLFGEDFAPGMQGDMLVEEDLFVVGIKSPTATFRLDDLKGLSIVMPARPNSVRSLLEQACQKRGIHLNVVVEVASPYTMIELAKAGIGVTVLPWSMLNVLRPSGLNVTRITNPVLSRTVTVATAINTVQTTQLLAVRKVLEVMLREQVGSAEEGVRIKAAPRKVNRSNG